VLDVAAAIARNTVRRNTARIRKLMRGTRDGPWMRPQEEAVVREVLTKLAPKRCLEWGAGFSTLQFPALLPQGAVWLSVEHDAAWASMITQRNTRDNVTVTLVRPDLPGWSGDGDAAAFASYLAAPRSAGPFDLVLIDGRARSAALGVAAEVLAPGGVVVLHDANRATYDAGCRAYGYQLLLRDARVRSRRPAGGVWIGSRDRPIESVLDVDFHRRIWAFYAGVGRLLA
jgi:predicted O-methyltransferase YrrM